MHRGAPHSSAQHNERGAAWKEGRSESTASEPCRSCQPTHLRQAGLIQGAVDQRVVVDEVSHHRSSQRKQPASKLLAADGGERAGSGGGGGSDQRREITRKLRYAALGRPWGRRPTQQTEAAMQVVERRARLAGSPYLRWKMTFRQA